MDKVIAKFGGSSLADAAQIKKVKEIVSANKNIKYVVVSAAGKRNAQDFKVTDCLIKLYDVTQKIINCKQDEVGNLKKEKEELIDKLKQRHIEIVKDLQIDFDVVSEIDKILYEAENKNTVDYLSSRGEYLSAKIMSKYLDAKFVDMKNVIIFGNDKKVDYQVTYENIKKVLCDDEDNLKIIPGFYGSTKDGEIMTFSRGGSDITGALVARAVGASVYENWTDVSGVLFADPRIADDVRPIEYITYTEIRELSYMGASVLHEETLYPVSSASIPVHILNTNSPADKGTMIVSNIPIVVKRGVVTGVAGKKGFTTILLQKTLMNEEVGYMSRLLKIFEDEKISIEHCPTGIDTISVVVETKNIENKKELILDKIKRELKPDVLNIEDELSIIAIVGEGMIYHKRIIMDIFKTLYEADVTVRMIDQGSSGINVIVGVEDSDYEKAIKALSTLQNNK